MAAKRKCRACGRPTGSAGHLFCRACYNDYDTRDRHGIGHDEKQRRGLAFRKSRVLAYAAMVARGETIRYVPEESED